MKTDNYDELTHELKQVDKEYRFKMFVTVLSFAFVMIWGFSKILYAYISIMGLS